MQLVSIISKKFKMVTLKEWRVIIFALLIAFILSFVSLRFSAKFIRTTHEPLVKEEISKIQKSLNEELEFNKKQMNDIIASGELNSYVGNRDIVNLISILDDQTQRRGVDMMLVTDKEGVVLTRTKVLSARGDNIFQTTAFGNKLSKNGSVAVIEKGKMHPLIMVAGSFIKQNGDIIGSLMAGSSLDNGYANKFKRQYLKDGTDIMFYTREDGIIGNTFNNKEIVKRMNAYFGIGSELISENLAEMEKEIEIEGKSYFVNNIIFPGIEESPGGVLVFYRSYHGIQSLFSGAIISLFFLLTVIFLFAYLCNKITFAKKNICEKIPFNKQGVCKIFDSGKEQVCDLFIFDKKRVMILFFGFWIVFAATSILFFQNLRSNVIKIEDPAYIIYNSTLKFYPESDILDRFSEKRIGIKILTGGEAINVVGAVVNYDPEAIEILDIIMANSFCYSGLIIEKTIDQEKGEANVACGLPNPGFSESDGIVAELLVQPLREGQFSLKFGNKTRVLANDGLGIDVLRLATNASYTVVDFSDEEYTEGPLPIYSYTHPNSERWYKRKNVRLSWPDVNGGVYKYSFNKIPDFNSGNANIVFQNSVNLEVEKDGIYFFHLAVPGEDGVDEVVSRYRVMIDSKPPSFTEARASHSEVKAGEIVRFDFEAEDFLSGRQEGFYIKVNDGIFLPIKPPLYVPLFSPGKYSVTVRAFDKANNFSDTDIEVTAKSRD